MPCLLQLNPMPLPSSFLQITEGASNADCEGVFAWLDERTPTFKVGGRAGSCFQLLPSLLLLCRWCLPLPPPGSC